MSLLPIYLLVSLCFHFVICISNDEVFSIREPPVPYYGTWDWRDKMMVSPVKNQGNCSASWAFSAVALIESHRKIHLNREETLSEQFLIDCDGSGVGCGSKSLSKAFEIIVDHIGGVVRNSEYTPYANKEQACVWDKSYKPVPVVGYGKFKASWDIMMGYIFHHGPLSATINSASMKKYKGGVDEPTNELCPAHTTDHAILIVGYSFKMEENYKQIPYWIIKNSWGEEWGEHGYYNLVMGRNACGIENEGFTSVPEDWKTGVGEGVPYNYDRTSLKVYANKLKITEVFKDNIIGAIG